MALGIFPAARITFGDGISLIISDGFSMIKINILLIFMGSMDLYFILVKPAVPGNIGAAARAIKTMGHNRLRLVAPCDHLGREARMLAHASEEVLEEAEVFDKLEHAIEGLDVTVATTAKTRDARVAYLRASELPAVIRSKGGTVNAVGLVFGGEESGLTNDEIRKCDLVSTIPMKQSYPSLNLGQSVMVYAYIMASSAWTESEAEPGARDEQGFRAMMEKSRKVLKDLDLQSNPALYHRILERLATLAEDDIHLMHSILNRCLKGNGKDF
jgi:tRNA/rRNA methyltransferase